MGLNQLTSHIYYLEHNPEVDRPLLGYVKGDKYSLAIDAGYSALHVQDFYNVINLNSFNKPDFTVITHWHYDHTFGMHAINGISIAHEKTNEFLENEKIKAKDSNYINVLKKEDIHFQKEYDCINELTITPSDISFTNSLTINLGNVTANIFHTTSPHSEDTVCIYNP